MSETKLDRCVWWINQGYKILPCQPKKKYLLAGYGEFRSHLKTKFQVEQILEKFPSCNLAVLGDETKIILDFDSPELYTQWANKNPQIALSYTERTPRGGYHVFICGDRPRGLQLQPGVELKSVCVIAPSVLDIGSYIAGNGEMISADPNEVFSLLSKPGTPTVRLLQYRKTYEVKRDTIPDGLRPRRPHGYKNLIEHIKADNDILHVFGVYRPESKIDIKDRYVMVLCPFHEDHKPSMFLDRDKQIFKCFTCGEHGDVINLYAKFEGIPVREAINRMARMGVRS